MNRLLPLLLLVSGPVAGGGCYIGDSLVGGLAGWEIERGEAACAALENRCYGEYSQWPVKQDGVKCSCCDQSDATRGGL